MSRSGTVDVHSGGDSLPSKTQRLRRRRAAAPAGGSRLFAATASSQQRTDRALDGAESARATNTLAALCARREPAGEQLQSRLIGYGLFFTVFVLKRDYLVGLFVRFLVVPFAVPSGVEVKISGVRLHLLGGKVLLNGVQYLSKDVSLQLETATICFWSVHRGRSRALRGGSRAAAASPSSPSLPPR